MKKYNLIVILALSLAFNSCQKEENSKYQSANFKVWGNCEMCKKTIEASLNKQDGIQSVEWDVKSKMIVVKYDSTTINENDLHKNIAASGYDTEKERGDDKSYNSLHSCCQYKRK
jgi:periplasmic mercuric ion binding protein